MQDWSEFHKSDLNKKLEPLRKNINLSVMKMIEKVKINNGIQPEKWFDNEIYELKNEERKNIMNGKIIEMKTYGSNTPK